MGTPHMNRSRIAFRSLVLAFVALSSFGTNAAAQALTNMRVGLTVSGAKFVVDGHEYDQAQNFLWPSGSIHRLEFPQTFAGTDLEPFQYATNVRYAFGAWAAQSTIGLSLPSGPVVQITALPTVTEVIGTVTKQYPLYVAFEAPSVDAPCTETLEADQLAREGVVFVDDVCYERTTSTWINGGPHAVRVLPYAGYYLSGLLTNVGLRESPTLFEVDVQGSTSIAPFFARAQRVRFATNPAGLTLLLDGVVVKPPHPANPNATGAECPGLERLAITPAGIPHVCDGDFDLAPGSLHTLAAEPVQTTINAESWVFANFSNGLMQNSVYRVPSNVATTEVVAARFLRGVRSAMRPNNPGLHLIIDGAALLPQAFYTYVWAEGSTHRVNAPLTQRDADGRMWRFVRWSDGGEADHLVTVPVGAQAFNLDATYEQLGQVQVTSTPPGVLLRVDGVDCTTPCRFDRMPDHAVRVEAPALVAIDESSRYEFAGWNVGAKERTLQFTFSSGEQTLNAHFHIAHHLSLQADPNDAASFRLAPFAADGFYAEGTRIEVTAEPNEDYEFVSWQGDSTSVHATEIVTLTAPTKLIAHFRAVQVVPEVRVRSAAGDLPEDFLAPGSLISIYGRDLAQELLVGPTNPLAQTLAGTYVLLDEFLLPLIFVAPDQINAQLPTHIEDGEYILIVHRADGTDVPAIIDIRRNAPGLFTIPDATPDEVSQVAANHADGSAVTMQSPARRGETITFYGTGLGPYDRPLVPGFNLPSTPTYTLVDPVAIHVANQTRQPASATGVPGTLGLTGIRWKLDAGLPTGNVEMEIRVNGVASNRVRLPIE
jgi:uncharacterized protein (TIGR03437 family)